MKKLPNGIHKADSYGTWYKGMDIKYWESVDFAFLLAMGLRITMYLPWQIGIFHEEMPDDKFLFYPTAGTLVHQDLTTNAFTRMGQKGEFPKTDKTSTERVYNKIMEHGL